MPTPTNFWPPYMGSEFIPETIVGNDLNLITPERYDQILNENPELYVHPLHLTPDRCLNMHFRVEEPEADTAPLASIAEIEHEFCRDGSEVRSDDSSPNKVFELL